MAKLKQVCFAHNLSKMFQIFSAVHKSTFKIWQQAYQHVAAVGGIEPQACALPAQRLPNNVRCALPRHGSGHSVHGDAPKGCQEAYPPSSSQRH